MIYYSFSFAKTTRVGARGTYIAMKVVTAEETIGGTLLHIRVLYDCRSS